jgi:type IV pilus assembly protein PilE
MALKSIRTSGYGMRRVAGFTLIEVIIVVVIVGFLMMVALPAYQESMRKGRRADAKAALMTAANREESFMLDRGTYTEDMADLNLTKDPGDPMISEERHYSITAAACGDGIETCFILTAIPSVDDPDTAAVDPSPQTDDERCAKFTLDSTGEKKAYNAKEVAATECW